LVGFEGGCVLCAEIVVFSADEKGVEGGAFVEFSVCKVIVLLDSIAVPFQGVVVMPDIDKLRKAILSRNVRILFQRGLLGQRRRIVLKILISHSVRLIKRSQFIRCVLQLVVIHVFLFLQRSLLGILL
jgi:hypothetical protein